MSDKGQQVQDYYGKVLQTGEDLKTNACCTSVQYPEHIKTALSLIHDEVHAKYYGCGLTIPDKLHGTKILDLGSGAGRDCFVLSHLVGQDGEVVGVDMTKEQLEVANRHIPFHTEKFGYEYPNVKFLEGNIARLDELNLADNYFDVIVSNCVINLCPDKEAVLKEAYRVLRPGGELFFSDVYADRRVPAELQQDKVLWGECLSGALYWNDFHHLAKRAGFLDPRHVESSLITITNEQVEQKVGDIKFYSVTYRLMKLPDLEPDCEDYGHSVVYRGTIPESPDQFKLDDHHIFKKGESVRVCGNSYNMLYQTRFRDDFDFQGTFDVHLGIYEGCGGSAPFDTSTSTKCC